MAPAQQVRDARALPGTGVTANEDQFDPTQQTTQFADRPSKSKGKATEESRDKTMVAWARADGGLTKEERAVYNNSLLATLWQDSTVTDSSPSATGSSLSGSAQDSATVATSSDATIVDSSPSATVSSSSGSAQGSATVATPSDTAIVDSSLVTAVPSASSDSAETISARCVVF